MGRWRLNYVGFLVEQFERFIESFRGIESSGQRAHVPHLLDQVSTEQQRLLTPVLFPKGCGRTDEVEQGEKLQQPLEDPTPPRFTEEQEAGLQQQAEDKECQKTPQVKQALRTRSKEFSRRA